MLKIDYKEIINPLILLPLIFFITFLFVSNIYESGILSLIIFLFFSLSNSILLETKKVIKKGHYTNIHKEQAFSLFIIIPLMFIVGVQSPITSSLAIAGFTDFVIQSYYNLKQRKPSKRVINLFKDKILGSERSWFHPISMQKYNFNGFSAEIIDSDQQNPSRDYICFDNFMNSKLRKSIQLHQFGGKNKVIFSLNLDKMKKTISSKQSITKNGILIENSLMRLADNTDRYFSKNIISIYKTRYDMVRILFEKRFVMSHTKEVYSFLSKFSRVI